MNKQWLEFCKKYKEKLKNDDILDGKKIVDLIIKSFTRSINFEIKIIELGRSGYNSIDSIRLDSEDLIYLYNKYSSKLHEELTREKQNLDIEYENAIKLYT